MKKSFSLLLMAMFTLIMISACSSNDDDSDKNLDELIGTWESSGTGNVAIGLAGAPFKTAKIVAVFNENNTYNVVSTDSAGANTTFTGTWTVGTEAEGAVRSITLSQNTPAALVSSGIFQVAGTTMTYEIIQSDPAITGVTPPSAAEGFGSTKFGGVNWPIWIQKYAKK